MQNLALGFGGYRAVVNCNSPKQHPNNPVHSNIHTTEMSTRF